MGGNEMLNIWDVECIESINIFMDDGEFFYSLESFYKMKVDNSLS